MKLAKFGGSSLSCASQIEKVYQILKNNQDIRYVVVSAPGKAIRSDIKITDSLIELATAITKKEDYFHVLNNIFSRFKKLIDELGLTQSLYQDLELDLKSRINYSSQSNFFDIIKSFGEDASAKIIASYLNSKSILAKVITPKEMGLTLTGTSGNGRIVESCFSNIEKVLNNQKELIIIPGFYGIDKNQLVLTFARGGSDLTGSIIASAMNVDVYENYTDVDNVFVASPEIIKNPSPIYEMTYKEMRELSHVGFNVLHDETILPLYKKAIPIHMKNTNNPEAQGTKIANTFHTTSNAITGIAGKSGFTSIYIQKFFMNREVGFVRKLLTIFEEENVPFEHLPSGIDYISIILETELLYGADHQNIINRIKDELQVDYLKIINDLAIVAIVGEKIVEKIILNRSIRALKDNDIQILNLSLAELGDSLIIGIDNKFLNRAIEVLYFEHFKE